MRCQVVHSSTKGLANFSFTQDGSTRAAKSLSLTAVIRWQEGEKLCLLGLSWVNVVCTRHYLSDSSGLLHLRGAPGEVRCHALLCGASPETRVGEVRPLCLVNHGELDGCHAEAQTHPKKGAAGSTAAVAATVENLREQATLRT